ncbi:response regulator NasT [Evansella vedderi]|uniref:Response regulator NasT n=1 Tax=Evansella vedderi TaxID=38282 RepID=A0ABT9ZNL5_9BACI|nr:response regulator [Evansella vedderi]MDQ0252827.1 response regulator NasT [Evansella vedderi]
MKKKLRVLIAEDEYLCLLGLRANIEELGHVVIAEATDGKSAVELAIKKKPDIVITDINMPILDGLEVIKNINETLFIPSIIVSGYYDENLIKRATEEGVLYYLVKPIDFKDIKIAIEITSARFEEFKRLQDELQDTKKALDARKHIEKAKGILMDRMKLKEPEAMKRLQKMSRDNNQKLVDVAKDLIKADSLFQQ